MTDRLYRSRSQKQLGGVCGGFAEYFNVDVTLIRLIALFFIISCGGFIFYLLAWILIPEEPKLLLENQVQGFEITNRRNNSKNLLIWSALIIALLYYTRDFLYVLPLGKLFWAAIVLCGIYCLLFNNEN